MSHPPPQGYRYLTSKMDAPYYYEDEDEYVGDYSESDAMSDAPLLIQTPNVTEIYRRKSFVNPLLEQYQQSLYGAPRYYYENMVSAPPVTQQMRRPAVPPVFRRPRASMMDDRTHYYSLGALQDAYRESLVYNSPQSANVRRPLLPPNSAVAATRPPVRRHPVTVPTPRFYRKTTSSNACKKPSMLCLPIASQRDPAVYRKARKDVEEPVVESLKPPMCTTTEYPHPLPMNRRHLMPMTNNAFDMSKNTATNDNNTEVQMSQSEINAALAHYDNILGDHVTEFSGQKTDTVSSKSTIRTKRNKSKSGMSHLRPRVPASIRQKQQAQMQKSQSKPKSKFSIQTRGNIVQPMMNQRLEVEEITTETLDNMLTELINSSCEKPELENVQILIPEHAENESALKEDFAPNYAASGPKGDANECSKSFNYDDISNNIIRSQEVPSKISSPRNVDPIRQCSSSTINLIDKSVAPVQCSRISMESAMELHRSKSYIVNLIDRALSKELGTAVNEKPTRDVKEVEQTQVRQTIELLNKNANQNKMDKDLCLEITQALNDCAPSISNTARQCEGKHSIACSCNVQEEPQYVKQLKQLRWGHLRHIQREVRRLEDLERFLDSCSGESFM